MPKRLNPRAAGLAAAAAALGLALVPLGWFAVSDAALLDRPAAMTTPYTSPSVSGDDYYLIRQLRAQLEGVAASEGLREYEVGQMYYAPSGELPDSMNTGWSMNEYLARCVQDLAAAGVLDEHWAGVAGGILEQSANQYACYYSSDSLGFTRISIFLQQDDTIPDLSVVIESKTSLPVSIWVRSPSPAPAADIGACLQAWVRYNNLDGLGDWAPPQGTAFAESGLYSARGGVLMTGGSGPLVPQQPEGASYFCLHLSVRELTLG